MPSAVASMVPATRIPTSNEGLLSHRGRTFGVSRLVGSPGCSDSMTSPRHLSGQPAWLLGTPVDPAGGGTVGVPELVGGGADRCRFGGGLAGRPRSGSAEGPPAPLSVLALVSLSVTPSAQPAFGSQPRPIGKEPWLEHGLADGQVVECGACRSEITVRRVRKGANLLSTPYIGGWSHI